MKAKHQRLILIVLALIVGDIIDETDRIRARERVR